MYYDCDQNHGDGEVTHESVVSFYNIFVFELKMQSHEF